MLASAHQCSLLPREISFKHTLQLLLAFSNNNNISTKQLLRRIAEKHIGNRTGRVEPRAIKRRRNDYPLLMKLREVARQKFERMDTLKSLSKCHSGLFPLTQVMIF